MTLPEPPRSPPGGTEPMELGEAAPPSPTKVPPRVENPEAAPAPLQNGVALADPGAPGAARPAPAAPAPCLAAAAPAPPRPTEAQRGPAAPDSAEPQGCGTAPAPDVQPPQPAGVPAGPAAPAEQPAEPAGPADLALAEAAQPAEAPGSNAGASGADALPPSTPTSPAADDPSRPAFCATLGGAGAVGLLVTAGIGAKPKPIRDVAPLPVSYLPGPGAAGKRGSSRLAPDALLASAPPPSNPDLPTVKRLRIISSGGRANHDAALPPSSARRSTGGGGAKRGNPHRAALPASEAAALPAGLKRSRAPDETGGGSSAHGSSGGGSWPGPLAEGLPDEIVDIARRVRATLALPPGQVAQLRLMLRTGLLGTRAVRFQAKGGRVLLSGRLSESGMIECGCSSCKGRQISASEFEVHAGSKDRRPADRIYLAGTDITLKAILQLVNETVGGQPAPATTGAPAAAAGARALALAQRAAAPPDLHMNSCYTCEEGGDLLCCDGCTAAFHLGCIAMREVPEGDWFCRLCQSEGRTSRKPAGSLAAAGPSRLPPRGAVGEGSFKEATGRLHMQAPSAARRAAASQRSRSSNRHRKLFDGGEGALEHGQPLYYCTTQGERLLEGSAVVDTCGGPVGILCKCCSAVISASQFEAHAGRGQRRAPYDNIFTEAGVTLKAMAGALTADEPDAEEGAEPAAGRGAPGARSLEDLADSCREVVSELDTLAGGCVLCQEVDFQRGPLGPRTIIICDQCEREFHVGCLRREGLAALEALPQGDWHCSEACKRVGAALAAAVAAGAREVPGSPAHTWQVMRGKDRQLATSWALRAVGEVLGESFDPIIDIGSGVDLLPLMVFARAHGEWDYKNVHTLLLRHKGKPVVAAVFRAFGPQLAELPLIATRLAARRQGHARVLLRCFEDLLAAGGVHRLVLPAAHESIATWKSPAFGFVDMPEPDVRLAKQLLRILIFPGTEVLWKELPGVPSPGGHHVLRPVPERTSQQLRDAVEAAAAVAAMVTALAVEAGEEEAPAARGPTVIEVAPHDEEEPEEAPAPSTAAAPGGGGGEALAEATPRPLAASKGGKGSGGGQPSTTGKTKRHCSHCLGERHNKRTCPLLHGQGVPAPASSAGMEAPPAEPGAAHSAEQPAAEPNATPGVQLAEKLPVQPANPWAATVAEDTGTPAGWPPGAEASPGGGAGFSTGSLAAWAPSSAVLPLPPPLVGLPPPPPLELGPPGS